MANKYVTCLRCNKKIYDGEKAIRRRGYCNFYCSFRCFALENQLVNVVEINDKTVKENEEDCGYGWEND